MGFTGMRHCKILDIYPYQNKLCKTQVKNASRHLDSTLDEHLHCTGLAHSIQSRSYGYGMEKLFLYQLMQFFL